MDLVHSFKMNSVVRKLSSSIEIIFFLLMKQRTWKFYSVLLDLLTWLTNLTISSLLVYGIRQVSNAK